MDSNKISFTLGYVPVDSFLHRLSGVTKFYIFIMWVIFSLITFDLRIVILLTATSLVFLISTKVPFHVYKGVFLMMIWILLLNSFYIFLFSPMQGMELIGSKTELIKITERYVVTKETLFYLLVVTLKYFSIFPITLFFVFATHPTEFSSSLNKMGVSYGLAYSVSLVLRYLPTITDDFVNILHSQQARGVDISKNVSLRKRISNVGKILIPLIFSSIDKAEIISNAMTLRGFKRMKSRTWYRSQKMKTFDYILMAAVTALIAFVLYNRLTSETLIWYPFTD